jgi:ATP-dependent DNA ligase
VSLPVVPPYQPMLARLARDLPDGDYVYEPKWDGFRCLAFRDGDDVDLRSRHDRPLARYFPEIVTALRGLNEPRVVLDGELILLGGAGFDFATLMARLHPAASRVERLSRETPASYIAFDVLAIGDDDLRARPFAERRERLEAMFASVAEPLVLTPATRDRGEADSWLDHFRGAGVDGVVAKAASLRYETGRRVMVKVKHERTADCVVAGYRPFPGVRAVSSLLLGLYDPAGALRHVGVVTGFPRPERVRLIEQLAPYVTPLDAHPWREGFLIGASPLGRLLGSAARWMPGMEMDWVPLRPELVVEVGFDQIDVDRMRHPARFQRWRPDREARSCTIDQIEVDPSQLVRVLEVA